MGQIQNIQKLFKFCVCFLLKSPVALTAKNLGWQNLFLWSKLACTGRVYIIFNCLVRLWLRFCFILAIVAKSVGWSLFSKSFWRSLGNQLQLCQIWRLCRFFPFHGIWPSSICYCLFESQIDFMYTIWSSRESTGNFACFSFFTHLTLTPSSHTSHFICPLLTLTHFTPYPHSHLLPCFTSASASFVLPTNLYRPLSFV